MNYLQSSDAQHLGIYSGNPLSNEHQLPPILLDLTNTELWQEVQELLCGSPCRGSGCYGYCVVRVEKSGTKHAGPHMCAQGHTW